MQVSRLIRVRYGTIELPKSLPRGGWVELTIEQVNYLRKLASMDVETRTLLGTDKHSVARAQVRSAKIRRAVRKHKTTNGTKPGSGKSAGRKRD